MSVTRYSNGLSPNAVQNWFLRDSPVSFSSSFVIACRLWLAANTIWATLLVAAGVTVALRWRIDRCWLPIALALLLSVGLVWRELRKSNLNFDRISLQTLLTLALSIFGAGYLLWPSLTKGAFVCVTGDAFFYSAFGQYLTDHHRGIEFGLPPIDQYATLLSETRFGTASILGFLAVIFHTSTAAVLRLHVFLILVNIFSGFVLLSRRFGCSRWFSLAAGLFAVIAGWTPNALNIGGLDNLLFISLFPFLLVRLELYQLALRLGQAAWACRYWRPPFFMPIRKVFPLRGPFSCLFSVNLCGPECIGSEALGALTCFQAVWFWWLFLPTFGYSLLRCSPISAFICQKAPPEFFRAFSPRFFPAMFGLGQEYPGTLFSPRDLALPLLMLASIVLGLAIWTRRRKSLILAFLILILLAVWQGLLIQYDYGVYKILFIGSMIWIPALFRGGTAVAHFMPRPLQPLGVTVGILILLGGTFAQRMEQRIPWREIIPLKWYSDLAEIRHKVGNRPVLLVCDKAFDYANYEFDQEWAAFFLRRVNLKIPVYYGYLGGFGSFMQRAKSPSEAAAFVLVNQPIEGAIWHNERFSLLELGSRAKIIGVQGVGLESLEGKPLIWLGSNATRFLLVSNSAQTANFSAWANPPGPEDQARQIGISIGGHTWQAKVSGALSMEVPLQPGLNYLDITVQDPPRVSAQPENNPKTFPLGLWDYRISEQQEVSN